MDDVNCKLNAKEIKKVKNQMSSAENLEDFLDAFKISVLKKSIDEKTKDVDKKRVLEMFKTMTYLVSVASPDKEYSRLYKEFGKSNANPTN